MRNLRQVPLTLLFALAANSGLASRPLPAAPADALDAPPGVQVELQFPEASDLDKLLETITSQFLVMLPDKDHDLYCRLTLQSKGQPDQSLGTLRVPAATRGKEEYEIHFVCCPVGESWKAADKFKWRLSYGEDGVMGVNPNPMRGLGYAGWLGETGHEDEEVLLFAAGDDDPGNGKKTREERATVLLYCRFDLAPKKIETR